jgi:diacylglycerol kinase family enzyme
VNASHAGVGAEAARRASSLKARLGPLAYPLGAVVAGARSRGWRLRVEVDGRVVADEPLLMVGVGNGPTIGGGAPLHPEARVDDRRLDVVVVTATEPSSRVGFANALRRGRHLDRGDVRYAQGAEVRISGEPVRHNVDGEVGEPLAARTYRLEPAAWRVVA